MNLAIPIYVEGSRPAGGTAVYKARPLFFDGPEVRGERLDRLMARLAQELTKHLVSLGSLARHESLAGCTFAPNLAQERVDLNLNLRTKTARCRFLFVLFRHLDRRIAFTPSVPEVWFDLARGEDLRNRAVEVLTKHFRELERGDAEVNPEAISLTGTAYVTPLEIAVSPPAVPPEPPVNKFMLLGDAGPMDGAAELRRVGRCLDWLYPEDLDRVYRRDAEVLELTRLLQGAENRPIVLLGPRQVGKTALLHEYVYRRVQQRQTPFTNRHNVWLLAPARLISGMSYVGQWENRLLAILKEARRKQHLLYFDDLLGLFQAGQSSSSSLSVAVVLKPYLERRRVRIVAEATPEVFRVLRERDRGFADLFHVLPLTEPAAAETMSILIATQRLLEGRHRCRFDLQVLPAVLDIQRRYSRDTAFPGKAATFFRQLAVKHAGQEVTRAHALAEFQARSGLALAFLDRQVRLEREKILEELRRQIIGQETALEAGADVLAVAKARLNDPDRPLAALLFLGPTGVGKTECARALARFLFGEGDRLLRFDLNEYGDPGAAARLMGTFLQPEGLLTSAIRRQPFAVVLFDEVEKGHPEVFDLLLQVLGEGRLTDALGRTADFTNAIIILTSNLGVREAESQLGFREDEATRDALFIRAAERFFRPEFFNRLDRVIPFHRLTRDHVRQIAGKLLREVFEREGLIQRRCILHVEEAALERIVDQGFEPLLGARALKRAVERGLTQPLAERLAVLPPGEYTAVRVYSGRGELAVQAQPLIEVESVAQPELPLSDPEDIPRRVRAVVRRIEAEIAPLRPTGPVGAGDINPAAYRYFSLRDRIDRIRDEERSLSEQAAAGARAEQPLPSYPRGPTPSGLKHVRSTPLDSPPRGFLKELAALADLHEFFRELANSALAPAPGSVGAALVNLVRQTALLERMAACHHQPMADRVLLRARHVNTQTHLGCGFLHEAYREAFPKLDLDAETWRAEPSVLTGSSQGILLHGPHALALARLEEGMHLFCPAHEAIEAVQVELVPITGEATPADAVREYDQHRRDWLGRLEKGETDPSGDPFRLGPVVRVYHAGRDPERHRPGHILGQGYRVDSALDLRTGMFVEPFNLTTCLLAALPLPAEFTVSGAGEV